jgi:hypothetical protein
MVRYRLSRFLAAFALTGLNMLAFVPTTRAIVGLEGLEGNLPLHLDIQCQDNWPSQSGNYGPPNFNSGKYLGRRHAKDVLARSNHSELKLDSLLGDL